MNTITTVLGDIPAGELGHCQPHEHVYVSDTPAVLDREILRINLLPASINELRGYRAAGGRSVVDAQPLAAGRNAAALRDASRMSGVNIVASTGYHLPFFYEKGHWIFEAPEDEVYGIFLRELEEGMYVDGCWGKPSCPTAIRAGLVKAVILDEPAAGRTAVLLRAAGRAAAAGGAPLMLHTEFGHHALEAIDLLGSVGLPPERILISHVDRQTTDVGIHKSIAAAGVYLEYDTITLFEFHDNEAEIVLIGEMLGAGYGDRLLIATDPTADRLKNYGGSVGMDYILTEFMPRMRAAGIPEAAIRKMTVENPARALVRSPRK